MIDMDKNERSVEEELATLGDAIQPAADWQKGVWARIEAQDEKQPVRVAKLTLVENTPRPQTLSFGARLAAFVAQLRSKNSLLASLSVTGTVVVMAAMMLLVVSSVRQADAAKRQRQLAAIELGALHDEIDTRLEELDQEHAQGRQAFRELYYAKDDQVRIAQPVLQRSEDLRAVRIDRDRAPRPSKVKTKARAKNKKSSKAACDRDQDTLCGL